MNANVILLILISIVNLFLVSAMFYILTKEIDKLKKTNDDYNKTMMESLKKFLASMLDEDAKRLEASRKICSQYGKLAEIFESFSDTCKGLKGQYKAIDDHFQKALTVMSNIEDRYSDMYEQIKHNDDEFKKLETDIRKLMADWSDVMNDMTAWYENDYMEDNNDHLQTLIMGAEDYPTEDVEDFLK